MKRTLSFVQIRSSALVASGTALVAATYGLVRLAYGLFLPDIQRDLHIDTARAGLIASGGSVVYCLAATIGFFVAARHPRVLVITAALAAGGGAAGMAASHHTAAFAAFAIIGSAGGGLASPALVTIVRRNVTTAADGRSQARVNAGTGPGLVAAGILALVLLPNWRLAWFCVAALTIAVAATVLVLDRPGLVVERAPTGHVVASRAWFTAHQQVIVAAFLLGAASAAVWNYGRTLLVDAGAGDRASVIAWIALGIGGTAVIATAPRMSALHPRTAWIITTLTTAAASAALGLAPHSTIVSTVACAAFGWGYTAATGALIAWTTLIDATRAPAGTSLLFVTLVLGQAVGAAAIGALVTSNGSAAAFIAAGAIALVAATVPTVGAGRLGFATGGRG